jgi:lambda family phage tail tape measure protein
MANRETKLKFLLQLEGVDKLRGLTNNLIKLNNNTTLVGKSSRRLTGHLANQKKQATQTIAGTKNLANSYRQLARSVQIGSKEFRIATRNAERLEARLRKLNATTKKGGLGGMAKTAGAIAGAGIFGGAEGAIGAGIGGIIGGAPGALVGGAIGAQAGMVRRSLGELASFSAQLELQRKALALVINDTNKFNQAQRFLGKTSKELAIPQEIITRQFTSLTASVLGAGLSVNDAETAFKAIAAGIRGTGGTLEDMKSAMRATSQVFSKGKVSAEELRQQLGERLPGAFTLFAESMNKTPAELDKALEQGKVTLDDFMNFANHLFAKYGDNAKILAESPAAAGDRLQTELSILRDNVGQLLKPIGANFQEFAADVVKALNPVVERLKEINNQFNVLNQKGRLKDVQKQLFEQIKEGGGDYKSFQNMRDMLKKSSRRIGKEEGLSPVERTELLINMYKNLIIETTNLDTATQNLVQTNEDLNTSGTQTTNNLKLGMQSYLNSIKDVGKQIQDATVAAFKGMEDALVNFVVTGKLNFADFTRSILADIARIAIRQAIIAPIVGAIFPGLSSASAKGNVFDKGIKEYAKGGIVNSPTIFAYGSGGTGRFGLMGEAGAEAILPLKRGRSGNLGVEASGSATNIVVNVDASGTSVEGDQAEGKALGLALSSAIQSELIKQQRPGGLLS